MELRYCGEKLLSTGLEITVNSSHALKLHGLPWPVELCVLLVPGVMIQDVIQWRTTTALCQGHACPEHASQPQDFHTRTLQLSVQPDANFQVFRLRTQSLLGISNKNAKLLKEEEENKEEVQKGKKWPLKISNNGYEIRVPTGARSGQESLRDKFQNVAWYFLVEEENLCSN